MFDAPLDFPCPLCGARVAEDCESEKDVLVIHIERIFLTPTASA